jgi:prepilin-type N-terminal cleavage/methylation domain-containing protein
MDKRKAFTLIELLVVIAIIALLMSILIPALKRAKEQARIVGCLAHLKQWNLIIAMYTEDNDGKFWPGVGSTGYWWPWQLEDRYKDWKANKIWFCPTAKKPIIDERGNSAATFNIFNAWGVFRGDHGGFGPGPNGLAGSYSINGYVLTIPVNATFEGGRPAKDGWRTPNAAGAADAPLFIDALRFDLWPLENHAPAQYEFAAWSGNNMARCCINRHTGFVGCSFLDFSARKVGLKELWTLKWHKSFNTAGQWTKAGAVRDTDWPEWIRRFKDY